MKGRSRSTQNQQRELAAREAAAHRAQIRGEGSSSDASRTLDGPQTDPDRNRLVAVVARSGANAFAERDW
jgi:hypothetical protein